MLINFQNNKFGITCWVSYSYFI